MLLYLCGVPQGPALGSSSCSPRLHSGHKCHRLLAFLCWWHMHVPKHSNTGMLASLNSCLFTTASFYLVDLKTEIISCETVNNQLVLSLSSLLQRVFHFLNIYFLHFEQRSSNLMQSCLNSFRSKSYLIFFWKRDYFVHFYLIGSEFNGLFTTEHEIHWTQYRAGQMRSHQPCFSIFTLSGCLTTDFTFLTSKYQMHLLPSSFSRCWRGCSDCWSCPPSAQPCGCKTTPDNTLVKRKAPHMTPTPTTGLNQLTGSLMRLLRSLITQRESHRGHPRHAAGLLWCLQQDPHFHTMATTLKVPTCPGCLGSVTHLYHPCLTQQSVTCC